jgi:RNA polymerase sigma factor (sigma-70 family)
MSICTRYHRNREDAESILNQSFLKIVTHLESYPNEIPFKLWIRKITVNTIIDEYRRSKRSKELFKVVDMEGSYVNHDMFDVNDFLKKISGEEIYKLIDALPEMQKKIFNLFVVDGFSHNEIAEMLQIPSGTSRWYLNTAKEELKTKILNQNIKPIITAAS